jgi:cytoplasmic iron level regulating protein YaaA (DUF328/UPF0246 family)
VLVLLPPSEGKAAAPRRARPADLDALFAADVLTRPRQELAARLSQLAAGPQEAALQALGLSAGQAAELERCRDVLGAPAAPVARVYTGVLFSRLDVAALDPAARRRAARRIVVQSALWGALRLTDRIPAYRLAIGARLPGLEPASLAAFWRPHLEAALPANELVVDLRSGGYAAAWMPREAPVVAVGARTPDGRVISHMAKATRGDVARILCELPRAPRTPEQVADVVAGAGFDVALTPGRPHRLDVVATP